MTIGKRNPVFSVPEQGIVGTVNEPNPLFALFSLILPACVVFDTAVGQTTPAGAPLPERRPHRMEAHGHVREDPWFWLREKENPAVIAHLKAENDWTTSQLAPIAAFQETLYREMRGRIREEDFSVPAPHGGYLYYSRTETGAEHAVEARRRGSMEGAEEIIIDGNERAKGKDYYEMVDYEMSPDHRIAAILENEDGSDICQLRFRTVATGEWLPDEVGKVAYGSAGVWAADNRTFFYLQVDDTQRAARLMRHRLGEPADADRLVYEEKDAEFSLSLYATADDSRLVLRSGNSETEESRVLPADQPEGEWTVIEPRTPGLRYQVDHANGQFWLLTDADGAENLKLVSAPSDSPGRAHWRDFLPYDDAVVIQNVTFFQSGMVLQVRERGQPQLRVADYQGAVRPVAMPEPAYLIEASENRDHGAAAFRFVYTSAITPQSVTEIDLVSLGQTVLKRREVVGGHDPTRYAVERIEATAGDGTRIPISLVRRRDTPLDGSAPLLLEGYGAYGDNYDPFFLSSRLSLLDRGFIQAIAHVRGGGELGRAWYDSGKLGKKPNSFTDFIACAEHLIARDYTRPDRLCASGTSAGGLLMGAVVNLRPDLFRSVVANVPFVDCLSTMSDPSLPLTTSEYVEWGNPEDAADYQTILSYSPYDNVAARPYPAILATGGLNDPRVPYWEPAKWVARLRSSTTSGRPVLLWTHLEAGHSGASGRFEYIREIAREYAFHLWLTGRADGIPAPAER